MKYIIKDWAGITMDWEGNPYSSHEKAWNVIDKHVRLELKQQGIDLAVANEIQDEYPELETVLDKIYTEYVGEYQILEQE